MTSPSSPKISVTTLTSAEFRRSAECRLSRDVDPSAFDPAQRPRSGDHRLADDLAPQDGRLHQPAAVLVPVISHRNAPTLLFTERSKHLKNHAGQIAFPGGKIDATDQGPIAAALREAEEEIGLDPSLVEPVGYLDPYLSSSGYRIIPVVAMIPKPFTLTLNKDEVETVFEVPLGFLMDPANHEIHEREWRGAQRRYFAMPYGERYIWGVTAGIIRALYERLFTP